LASPAPEIKALFHMSMEIVLFQAGAQILGNERSNIRENSFLFGV